MLWDMPGADRYLSHAIKKIKEAHIVLIVYDVTSEDSFVKADEYIEIAKECARDSAVIMVVGNKHDLTAQRKVQFREGKALAALDDFDFEEVSARDRAGVVSLLAGAVRRVRAKRLAVAERKALVMELERRKSSVVVEGARDLLEGEEEKRAAAAGLSYQQKQGKRRSRLCHIL